MSVPKTEIRLRALKYKCIFYHLGLIMSSTTQVANSEIIKKGRTRQ